MPHHQPFQVTGFHSCDKTVGLQVLTGEIDLKPSKNIWDWLGEGIYFWEQNPSRALEYAIESAEGKQFNKVRINIPFVLGATIELGNCLNLIEPQSVAILKEAYAGLLRLHEQLNKKMPVNEGDNRKLDCAIFRYIHQVRRQNGDAPYDTIRAAFSEGIEVYPGASFTSRGHLQICVLNTNLIRGYFLPRPLERYNPYLKKDFTPKQ